MYTTKQSQSFIVSDSAGRPLYWMVRDVPAVGGKGQDLLMNYLSDAKGIFKSECDILLDTHRNFTDADSERLLIMLRLLIDARKTWQEEEAALKR